MIPDSAKKTNIRMSVKKYLTDVLETAQGRALYFDRGFLLPDITDLDEWITVNFGAMTRGGLSDFTVEIVCATRGDSDGDGLAGLADAIFEAMTDGEAVDGKRRITLFDVSTEPWIEIGKLLVREALDSEEMPGPDQTKYQLLTCRICWVAKI